MPTFETAREVPFTAEQMFAVVADVEKYPLFLPLCETLTVRSREQRDGATVLVATMGVGYKAIRESFTTRVTLRPAERRIEVRYLDGPFRHLENLWRFAPRENGCEVHFYISYEFRSAVLGAVMGAVFDKAFRKFAEAFEARARVLYAPPASLTRA